MLAGHEPLLDAYPTDVRALCAKVRADRGAAADPVAAHRASGYVDGSAERAATAGGATTARHCSTVVPGNSRRSSR